MTDKERIDELVVSYDKLKKEISKVIVGQQDVVDQVCISIFLVLIVYWLVFQD